MRVCRHTGGFSLVEVLVSLGLGMMILLLALGAMGAASDGYMDSTNQVAATREARALMGLMAADLAKALPDEVPMVERSPGDWPRDRVGFLSLQPLDVQQVGERVGDVCAVVYYLRDWDFGGQVVPSVWRGFRSSGEVFEALRDEDIESLYGENPRDEPIARGVVAMEVEPLVRGADGEWVRWEENGAGPRVPAMMRLRLVMARRELMGKLQTADDWENHDLLGAYNEAEESRYLEVFEFIHPIGHAG